MARIITPADQARKRVQRQLAKNIKAGKPTLPKSITEAVKRETKKQQNKIRDAAYKKMQQLQYNYKYDDETVRRAVYELMTVEQADWTANATLDEILGRASIQPDDMLFVRYAVGDQNLWWYH